MSTLTVISLPVCVMSVARVSKTWSSLETTTWWVVITGLRLNNLINNVHFCVAGKELHSVNKGSSEQQLKNKCPDCGQVLSSSRLLRARRNAVHLKMRSHLCNYCGYKHNVSVETPNSFTATYWRETVCMRQLWLSDVRSQSPSTSQNETHGREAVLQMSALFLRFDVQSKTIFKTERSIYSDVKYWYYRHIWGTSPLA